MAQHAMTQRERLAALEAHLAGHSRVHELTEQVWAAKLDAIEARLVQIERALTAGRENGNGVGWWRLSRRDISVVSGTAALTSALWWLAELFRAASGA